MVGKCSLFVCFETVKISMKLVYLVDHVKLQSTAFDFDTLKFSKT